MVRTITILFMLSCISAFAQKPFNLKLQPFAIAKGSVTDIGSAGDERMFVVSQEGIIYILNSDGTYRARPFMSIANKTQPGGERGLLGIAFHPQYAQNGYFYLDYTDLNGDTRVSRFSVKPDSADVGDPKSEKLLLTVKQPYSNHNGGQICFGPDGYLYIALGDGGSGGDPNNNGQNKKSLLGKLLRIDVNKAENGKEYAIPTDNPFVNNPDFAPEIWAYGLRNPWRFSFDRATNDLWIADVGQNKLEEVDFQHASSKGGENYGWRCYEGNDAYNTEGCGDKSNYVFPIFQYPHNSTTGGCSITGGYVYRGKIWKDLQGWYFFGDYCTGNIWATKRHQNGTFQTEDFGKLGADFSTFGQNTDGELFAVQHSSGGNIWRLIIDTCLNVSPKVVSRTGNNFVCQDDSLRLTAEAEVALSYSYRWFKNGTQLWGNTASEYFVKDAGEYSVELSFAEKCAWRSASITIAMKPKPDVKIVSLPNEVLDADSKIALIGQPPGGIFSGKGVNGAYFNPAEAGIGKHEIKYSYTEPNGCSGIDIKIIKVKSEVGVLEQQNLDFTAEIFPNPTEDEAIARLYFPKAADISLQVVTNEGKTIFSQSLSVNAGVATFSLGRFIVGAYRLRVISGNQTVLVPFAIVR